MNGFSVDTLFVYLWRRLYDAIMYYHLNHHIINPLKFNQWKNSYELGLINSFGVHSLEANMYHSGRQELLIRFKTLNCFPCFYVLPSCIEVISFLCIKVQIREKLNFTSWRLQNDVCDKQKILKQSLISIFFKCLLDLESVARTLLKFNWCNTSLFIYRVTLYTIWSHVQYMLCNFG